MLNDLTPCYVFANIQENKLDFAVSVFISRCYRYVSMKTVIFKSGDGENFQGQVIEYLSYDM